jgi:tRNA nucleotidyltransferase (CCA-adding enzyme)
VIVEPGSPQIIIPHFVEEICVRIQKAGFKCFVVGGALRDQLLGERPEPEEWDLATSARPEEVRDLFPKTVPTGIAHGTVTVLADDGACEVTTFRQESDYSDARHPDRVSFLTSIDEDLARRDFTVNALAYDPVGRVMIDPYGGIQDLRDRILRAVGSPWARFNEDGLRPLRAARFVAVLGFRLERETFDAMEGATRSFLMVSAERKRDEIIKMMGAAKPSLGWEVLRKSKYIKAIFPEMIKMVGTMQGGLHRYDVWNHSIMTCDFCRGPWPVRLAALLHDIGKPFTAERSPAEGEGEGEGEKEEKEERTTFYRHEEAGAEIVERWMERMKFSKADVKKVTDLVRYHMVLYSSQWGDAAVRRFIRRVGRDMVDDVLCLAEADIKARGTIGESLSLLNELRSRVREELSSEVVLSLKDLAVSGIDIMRHLAMDPGPRVGRILGALLEAVIDNPSLNRREKLLSMAEGLRQAPAGEEDEPS